MKVFNTAVLLMIIALVFYILWPQSVQSPVLPAIQPSRADVIELEKQSAELQEQLKQLKDGLHRLNKTMDEIKPLDLSELDQAVHDLTN